MRLPLERPVSHEMKVEDGAKRPPDLPFECLAMNGPYSPRGKWRPRTPRWYNAALTHTKWMGNPSSPTLSSNCENGRACFCQTSPGLHVWGVLVPIRVVFNRSNRPRSQKGDKNLRQFSWLPGCPRWTTLKQRGSKASVAHTTTPKKARLYSCSLQLLFQQLEKSESRERSREKWPATKKSTVCWRRRKRQGKRNMIRTRERTDGLKESSSSTLFPSHNQRSHTVFLVFLLHDRSLICKFCVQKVLAGYLNTNGLFWCCRTSFFTLIPARMRYACFVSLCFRVFHLDNHSSWEHQRRFCLCSIPLVDLSA